MKKFIIERNLPGAGKLTAQELKSIAQNSCDNVRKLDSYYQWVETFVTPDKMYCIHIAENEDTVRKHAQLCDIPVNSINEIKTEIGPMTSIR